MFKNMLTRLSVTKEGKLMRAALNGNIQKVKNYLNQGINPNFKTNNGYTALMGAALEGHIEVVTQLLKAGADPQCSTQRRSHCAIRSGA